MDNPMRWAAVLVLAALFLVFAAYNGWSGWQRYVRREPAPSWAPIAGGLFGSIAILAVPAGSPGERLYYAWLPLILDVSVPATAAGLWLDRKKSK